METKFEEFGAIVPDIAYEMDQLNDILDENRETQQQQIEADKR